MTSRDKIQLSIIGILVVAISAGILTDFEFFADKEISPELKPTQPPTQEKQIQAEPQTLKPAIITHDGSSEKHSGLLTDIFKRVEISVVQITTRVSETNPNIIINGVPLESQSTKLGSGFVYDSSGHIITNNHVIEGATSVDVRFIDGNIYSAKVVGTDPYNDIAVLQITDDFSDESIQPLPLGDSSQLDVGEQVIAIGNPHGLSNTMTTGIVSQVGRLLPNTDVGYSIPSVIQTDAAINPGNSGGPLLDLEGHVIGINTAIQSGTGDFAGIGFAVPSNTVKRLAPSLIADGKYPHPWLGVAGTSVTPDIAEKLDLPKNYKGVFITMVVQDGPAHKAGLEEPTVSDRDLRGGDIIIALDGMEIRDIDDLIIYLAENKNVGDSVVMKVNRDNTILELTAILAERPAN